MQLPDIQASDINPLLARGLLGAGGGGLVSALLSHRNQDPRESSADRRRRIMRNALVGATLGGAATTAIPAGFKLLAGPEQQESLLSRAVSGVGGTVADNAAGIGTGVLGLVLLRNQFAKRRLQALNHLAAQGGDAASRAVNKGIAAFGTLPNGRHDFAKLRSLTEGKIPLDDWLRMDPANNRELLKSVMLTHGHVNPVRTAELMNEAGHPVFNRFKGLTEKERKGLNDHLKAHLTGPDMGPIDQFVGRHFTSSEKFKPTWQRAIADRVSGGNTSGLRASLGRAIANFSPQSIGWQYSQWARPSQAGLSAEAYAPLVPAAALAAQHVQDSVAG